MGQADMTCGIIGDSIALGLALAAHMGCDQSAVVGRTPAAIAAHPLPRSYDWAVISAGSNNPRRINIEPDLRRIRRSVHAKRVIWVLPHSPQAARVVYRVALSYGDGVQAFRAGRDNLHPRSYSALWRDVRDQLR